MFQAIADFDKAIDINSGLDLAYHNRRNAYADMGLYDEALASYEYAIELNPMHTAAYNDRGIVYYSKPGLYDRAIADFDQAIEIDPTYTLAYLGKGLACERVGCIQEALIAYKTFIQLSTTDGASSSELVELVRQRVAELGG